MKMDIRSENEVLKMKVMTMGCTLDIIEYYNNAIKDVVNEVRANNVTDKKVIDLAIYKLDDCTGFIDKALDSEVPKGVLNDYRENKQP